MGDNDTQNEDMPPQQQNRTPARYNWGRGVNVSSMVGVVTIVGTAALLLFGLSLCSSPPAGKPSAGAGGGILERNVKAAFGNDTPEDRGEQSPSDSAPPSSSDTSGHASQSRSGNRQSPQSGSRQQQSEQESPQEQQDAIKAQEELRGTQREQVPSILPENPPAPVPLGGNNY